ncbi:MAG: hypothetical protein RBR94_00500 [Bacilli bacterium]|jgi:hypothetical protein|nr:hypothetical protein [Bacilli bacterium]NLN80133.1 zinc ribbon domain-containing protein [Erysipelotrichia bacterium]
MRISKIVNRSYLEVNKYPRFDFKKKTIKPLNILKPLMYLLSVFEVKKRKSKVTKINFDKIKPPYFMFVNHNSFFDFKVATLTMFPTVGSNIVAIDGFINRELLLRAVGCIGKRKFTTDPHLIMNIKHIIKKKKGVVSIYPEARYSLLGTSSPLPDSLGKLVKLFDVPVLVLINSGHHLAQPVWNLRKRKVETSSTLTKLFDEEDLKKLSVEEINTKLKEAFYYDDYKYQKDHNILISEPFRAEGLHNPLYKCPVCGSEEHMNSKGTNLFCEKCGASWYMNELGGLEHPTKPFPHIPTWFEWQRQVVSFEIKNNKYHYEEEVMIESLPNSKGFYRIGKGKLTHSLDGFILTLDGLEEPLIKNRPLENFGAHIEYNYFGKGNLVSLSTERDTYYIYPINQKKSVTKLHFAAEELYTYTKAQLVEKKNV